MIEVTFEGMSPWKMPITRASFEEMNADLLAKLMAPVEAVLKDGYTTAKQVDDVVLVGGSTRVPAVVQKLTKFFGKPPLNSVDADEAVAYGAAIQAAKLANSKSNKAALAGMALEDVIPMDLGIELNHDKMDVVIPKNATIPCSETKMYTTSEDYEKEIKIKVLQGNDANSKNNSVIGEFTLAGFEPKKKGETMIEVTFAVDDNGIITITAQDVLSDVEVMAVIQNDKMRLSQEEIAARAKELEDLSC